MECVAKSACKLKVAYETILPKIGNIRGYYCYEGLDTYLAQRLVDIQMHSLGIPIVDVPMFCRGILCWSIRAAERSHFLFRSIIKHGEG